MSMANLELPVTNGDFLTEKAIPLCADLALASSLRDAGIDVATVANNHALDYGS